MSQLFAADALLPTGWARNVHIAWDGAGRITAVTPNAQRPEGAAIAPGPVIPGMPNLRSSARLRASPSTGARARTASGAGAS